MVFMANLTPKQRLFIQEYLIDKNASRAAIAAGYSKKTASFIGSENLKKPYIKDAIEEVIRNKEDELIAKQDEVLRLFTEACRGLMQEECVVVESAGDFISEARIIKKQISPKDRIKALDSMAKHYGLLKENIDINANIGITFIDDIE
jgi:phage terminase small subunit